MAGKIENLVSGSAQKRHDGAVPKARWADEAHEEVFLCGRRNERIGFILCDVRHQCRHALGAQRVVHATRDSRARFLGYRGACLTFHDVALVPDKRNGESGTCKCQVIAGEESRSHAQADTSALHIGPQCRLVSQSGAQWSEFTPRVLYTVLGGPQEQFDDSPDDLHLKRMKTHCLESRVKITRHGSRDAPCMGPIGATRFQDEDCAHEVHRAPRGYPCACVWEMASDGSAWHEHREHVRLYLKSVSRKHVSVHLSAEGSCGHSKEHATRWTRLGRWSDRDGAGYNWPHWLRGTNQGSELVGVRTQGVGASGAFYGHASMCTCMLTLTVLLCI